MGKTYECTFVLNKENVDNDMYCEIVGAIFALTNPKDREWRFVFNQTRACYEITLETTKKFFKKAMVYCSRVYPGQVFVKLGTV